MAAVATSPSPYSSLRPNSSSRVPNFHRISVKIPFCNARWGKTLVCVGCHNPNLDSVVTGSGSKSPTHLPDDHDGQASASSHSAAIDFLTLCHRLKVALCAHAFEYVSLILL